ncbi:MAG: M1 family metallopeptidase [Anaerolineae bacterium]|nr:M1 family metallopeptidase [Anaerolineae bacterium]
MTKSIAQTILPILASLLLMACATQPVGNPAVAPAVVEEEGVTPIISATSLPSLTPMPTPAGGLTVYEQAMREGFEADVARYGSALQYRMILTLQDDPVKMIGEQEIRLTNITGYPLDEVVLRLYPNALFPTRLLDVSAVAVDGQAASALYEVGDTALRVGLPQTLEPGGTATITASFRFDLPPGLQIGYGRFVDLDGVVAMPSFFPMVSVYEDGEWWSEMPGQQGDPVYSDVALYDVTLAAPSNLQIASTGTVIEEQMAGETTTYRIVTGPVRDFAVSFSDAFEVLTAYTHGIAVNVWSYEGTEAENEQAMEVAIDSLLTYDDQFGKYPFNEVDVIEAPITAGGIEYPGLIFIMTDLWDTSVPFFEIVIAHEMGHQWWYSMVGNNQVSEPWLDEGLTEYSVEVYFRQQYGDAAAASVRQRYQDELAAWMRENAFMPVGLPAEVYDEEEYGVFVYRAGALFYDKMVDDYGEAAVTAFLRDYYEQQRYQNSSNAELQALVEDHFGVEADAFYRFWVYGERE